MSAATMSQWLRAHGWFDVGDEARRALAKQWAETSRVYGEDSEAALGCLLGLARKAWGCDEHRRLTVEVAGSGWCVIVRNGRHRPPSRAMPGWDLDPICHPRYRNVQGPFGDNEFTTERLALAAALQAAPEPARYPIGQNGLCTTCYREVCEHTTPRDVTAGGTP